MLDTQTSTLIQVVPVTFPSGAATLNGTLFLPAMPPRAALVLNGATAVAQRFYRHFATWLAAEHGVACLTYDYTDMGASARGHVRDSQVTMAHWMLVDQPAARAEMRRQLPDTPLWVLGHSLGALMLPMQDGIEDIEQVIAVCSGHAYHRDHPWPYQAWARLFWFGHAPLAAQALGYMPGKLLRFGEDLPKGVYWQWRRWCTSPQFFWPDVGTDLPHPDWARSDAQVRLVAAKDDVMIPPHCVWRLEQTYGAEGSSRVLLDPKAMGLDKLGHLAVFSRANKEAWPAVMGWDQT